MNYTIFTDPLFWLLAIPSGAALGVAYRIGWFFGYRAGRRAP